MPNVTGKGYKCNVHNGAMGRDGNLEPGCHAAADIETDGSEVDAATTLVPVENLYGVEADPVPRGRPQRLGRKAVPGVRVCTHHANWPFSDDARRFAKTPAYEGQRAEIAERASRGNG